MITIHERESADLADLRRDCLASMAAPLDGMWEAFVAMSRQMEIRADGERAGYFCVDSEGQLLQFFVVAPLEQRAGELFGEVIARDDVTSAIVSTADQLFLGLCLDAQKGLTVHSFLFHDQRRRELSTAKLDGASLDLVETGELDTIGELQRASLDADPGEWLDGYLENLVGRRELYALRLGEEILATGEARVSESQSPFVDLGVITMRSHRGRGVATHTLRRLKQLCYDRELVPICSTTVDNQAARRAIEKAGFVSRHRILKVVL